jgi:2'-5' RNA ligase
MRAFFAVDLPDALADPLAAVQDDLDDAEGLRVTDPTQAHVTLKFLGEVDAGEDDGDRPSLDDVIAAGGRAVDRAAVDPFKCTIADLGVFPNREYVSVVWAGVDSGTEELTALHEALEAETTALGVDPEEHEFTPHVTLGRVENATGAEAVRDALDADDPEIGSFAVDEIRLVESTLTADGPEYEVVRKFELG